MAVIIVIHFVLVTMTQFKATSAQIDERTAELTSEATREMLKMTESAFRASIPILAQRNAQELTRRIATQFAFVPPAALPAPTSAPMLNDDGKYKRVKHDKAPWKH